jgi:8-oxo-dGTP pyrophosphatase MutT (NUDIX family)
MKTKKSIGLALCQVNNGDFEILMIKKRVSYSFVDFINGKYRTDENLRYLFNTMTIHEKSLILSHNYENLWTHYYGLFSQQTSYNNDLCIIISKINKNNVDYIKKKSIFEDLISKDNGKHLNKLITSSENIEGVWEIPKGRRNANEKSIDTAIREFKEETNIGMSDYNIFFNEKPIYDVHNDCGTTYINEYYIATPINGFSKKIKVSFNNKDQILEVEQIRWVKLRELEFLPMDKKIINRMMMLFRKIRNIYRRSNKHLSNTIFSEPPIKFEKEPSQNERKKDVSFLDILARAEEMKS